MKDRVLELLTQADSEKQQGNIEVAINTLETAQQQLQGIEGSQESNRNDSLGDGKEVIYLHTRGNILYEIKEHAQALECYEKLVEQQPNVDAYKALKAACLLKCAKLEKKTDIKVAINTLEIAKQLLQGMEGSQQSRRNDTSGDEDEIIYLYKYGNILYETGEHKRALKYYEELVEQQPSVDTYKALGDCLRKLNLYGEALEQYKAALKEEDEENPIPSDIKAAILNSRGLTYMVKAMNLNNYGSTYTPKMDNKKALKDFEKAIEISNDVSNPNPLYYCNKGFILYTLGKEEQGFNSFKAAEKLVEDGKVEELTKQNINYIKEILKPFIDLKSTIKTIQLQIKGCTDIKLVKAFQEHQEKINELEKRVMDITSKQDSLSASLDAKQEKIKEEIKVLTKKVDVLEEDLQVATGNIEEIKEQLYQLVTKEEFEKLQSTYKDEIISLYDNQLKIIETDVNGIKGWKVYIDETLTKANVFGEVETKRKFESLENDHGTEVYEYATKFYEALNNSLHAYKMISTGLIQGKSGDYTGTVKNTSKVLTTGGKILTTIGKTLKFTDKCSKDVSLLLSIVGGAIPIAGGIISIVNGFYEKYCEVKLNRAAKKVVDSISGSLLEKDLNLAIASSAIAIAIAKEQTIKEAATNEPTKLEEVKKWFSDKSEELAAKITKIKGVPESKVSKMALEDVSLFIIIIINSIIKSDDKLVESSKVEELDKKIEELFEGDIAIKQLFKKLYDDIHKKGTQEATVVQMVDKVVYHNPLLNNSELMKDVAKLTELYGMSFNKVINLSKGLSLGLITEAIENKDSYIVLGGLLSLDSSEYI